jgi:hypothetical protein
MPRGFLYVPSAHSHVSTCDPTEPKADCQPRLRLWCEWVCRRIDESLHQGGKLRRGVEVARAPSPGMYRRRPRLHPFCYGETVATLRGLSRTMRKQSRIADFRFRIPCVLVSLWCILLRTALTLRHLFLHQQGLRLSAPRGRGGRLLSHGRQPVDPKGQ